VVAFGDQKVFLLFLRVVHSLRECTTRKNSKRDEADPSLRSG